MSASYRVRRSVEKNAPEFRALASLRMPGFALPFGGRPGSKGVPVFCFHDVVPETFSAQLEFLRANGYRTLDADEVEERVRGGRSDPREIALTFDDATWTFWTYAYPLLRAYGFRAVLFAIPTLLSVDDSESPTWDPHLHGDCDRRELDERRIHRPFCTWQELQVMHESGVVDVQSHSLTHVRVPVSPRILDFVHPGFDPYYGNFDIPLSVLDESEPGRPSFRLGAPLFQSAPRLRGRSRFHEDPELDRELAALVESEGGGDFFANQGWRRTLRSVVERWPAKNRGHYETAEELEAALHREFRDSKAELERSLPGKSIRHFAYPWFAGSAQADRIAAESGYRTVFGGPDMKTAVCAEDPRLVRVQRIGEEYLWRLPGSGRRSFGAVWQSRLRGSSTPRPEGPRESTLTAATRSFCWKPAYAWFRSLELHAYESADLELQRPVLDLGCGNGMVARTLIDRGILSEGSLFGIDYEQLPLTQAHDAAIHTGLARADGRRLPFADGAFGSVVSNGVLSSIPEGIEHLLDEVARILRPGGTFVTTIPTDRFIDSLLWPRVLGSVSEGARRSYVRRINRRLDHRGEYASVEEWRTRWEKSGLRVDRVEGFLSTRAGSLYNLLAMHLFRFFGLLREAPSFLQVGTAVMLRFALRRAYARELASSSRMGYVLIVGHRGAARPDNHANGYGASPGDTDGVKGHAGG